MCPRHTQRACTLPLLSHSMKNTGKPSEEIFDESWKHLGKRAFIFKFEDTAALRGRNKGKAVMASAQPSDRLVIHDGDSYFAEIKSTVDPDRFKFSLLRKSQGFAAASAIAAGGTYFLFIHCLTRNRWYCLPYEVVAYAKTQGKGSLTWAELEPHAWSFPRA